ncbi:MAG: hypothetical protein AABX07_06210 [Nanoarchaeota archaeon]
MHLFRNLKKETNNIILNLLFAILNLLVIALFFKNAILTCILLGILAILSMFVWKCPLTIATFSVMAVIFIIPEIYFVKIGIWEYTFANFYSIPAWLPILWGNTGIFIYRMAIEFERLGFHK